MIYRMSVFLIFLGSIFATSEKFVDVEISAKFYFTIFAVFIGIIILVLSSKNICLKCSVSKIASLSVVKWIFIAGVLQAIYGLAQYVGICKIRNSTHAILGSFDNPAGFAAVLSLISPIGFYWLIKSRGPEKKMLFFLTGIVFISICLSGDISDFYDPYHRLILFILLAEGFGKW